MDEPTHQPGGLEHCKYWAFISYSHRDETWGAWLHRALETYRIPSRFAGRDSRDGPVPKRLRPIFRDTEELPAAGSLTAEIRAALQSSRYLVVLCSPASASSIYVEEEIRYFKALGRADRILCLIIGGEPNTSVHAVDAAQESFAAALRFDVLPDGTLTATLAQPIAADVRPGKGSRRDAMLRILAGVLQVGYDDLRQRDRRRQRMRLVTAIASAAAMVALLAGTWAWQERQKQREMRLQAIESYTSIGQQELSAGNPNRAAVYLGEAYRLNGDGVRLRLLLAHSLAGLGLQRDSLGARKAEARIVRFSSNGEAMATVAGASEVDLWDGRGQHVAALGGHEGRVSVAEFTPDGAMLATGGFDRRIRIWDARTGKLIESLEQHPTLLSAVAFSPDGRSFVTIGVDGSAMIWNLQNRRPRAQLSAEQAIRAPAAFSADGTVCVTRGYTGDRLFLWNSDDGRLLDIVHLDETTPFVQMSKDGALLVAPGGGTVEVRDPATGQLRGTLAGDLKTLIFLGPSGDRNAVLVDERGNVEVWDVAARKRVLEFATGYGGGRVADSDGRRLVMFTPENKSEFSVWNLENGGEVARLGTPEQLGAAALNPASNLLVTGDQKGVLAGWHLDRRSRNLTLPGHSSMVNVLAFNADGSRLVTAGSETTASVWDTATGRRLATLQRHSAAIFEAVYSRDGGRLFTISVDGALAVWNTTTFELVRYLEDWKAEHIDVASIPATVVAVALNKDVLLWKPDENTAQSLDRVRSEISAVRFSPDGRWLATGNGDGTVDVWESATAKLGHRLWAHAEPVKSLQFSPDSAKLLTARGDAIIWSIETGRPLVTLEGHAGTTEVARFSADGNTVVTGGGDGSAKLWNAQTGALLHSLDDHLGAVSLVAFSPRGTIVATAGADQAAKLWEVESGKLIRPLPASAGAILELAFDPAGDVLAIAAKEPAAHVWDLTPETRSAQEISDLIARRSALRIVDGRLVAADTASGPGAASAAGAGAQPGQDGAGESTASPEEAVHQFIAAIAGGKQAELRALIADTADSRVTGLREAGLPELHSLSELFEGAKATETDLRMDGKAAYVTFETTRGRMDVQLERARDRWQIVNVSGRPRAASAQAGR